MVGPHLPEQPIPMYNHHFSEQPLPDVQHEPHLAQPEAISSCPVAACLEEEMDPNLATASLQALVE